ncbi:MAG: metal ABC transporter permease [Actinomycetota bacterium]|nr:metal ABC transporter permease [Actinomycetota bacterium]
MNIASGLPIAGVSVDLVSDFRQLTAFPFMVNALQAGAVVAVMAGVGGWFMVLRRESFAGHTLSVMAFPGAAGALLLGLPAAGGYFAFCGACALAIGAGGAGGRARRGEQSALTGAVQAFGLACGFVFLSLYRGVLGGYENLLFGDFLGITRGQILVLLIACVLALGFFTAVGRPLLFASIDEPVARARGVPVRRLSLAFLVVLGLAVAATAQITGALLVFALLVAPAATAQAITPRIGASLLLTVLLGTAITWVGLALAYFSNYPVGFYITALAFGVYAVARIARAVIEHPTRPGRRVPAAETAA